MFENIVCYFLRLLGLTVFIMEGQGKRITHIELFHRLDYVMRTYNFPAICFKPKQVQCLERLIEGNY